MRRDVRRWLLASQGLAMPILNRITGGRQDLSQFAGLQGNLGALLIFFAVSWTLAAVGEEIIYRGYLPLRITEVFGANTVGILAAVVLSSVLFGLAHTEQGTIGVILTFLDALFFSFLRWRFKNCGRPSLVTDSQHHRAGQLLSRWPDVRTVVTSNGR